MGLEVMKARLWGNVEGNLIECLICERRCRLGPGARGVCRSYMNVDGELVHIAYGRLSAVESRPIEIKPLFHYWPNSTALTYSTYGCNFYCPWCQNSHLSFSEPQNRDYLIQPEELINIALRVGDEGLSASFNEPTVNFDYVLNASIIAKERGLYSMMVTNGYLTVSAVKALLEAGVDGWSVDIKGCPNMKRALASIDHSIVYRNSKLILDLGGHVEMVYLMVTNTNDFEECVEWILDMHLSMLGPEVPLHINRYYPAHAWREPPTPIDKLLEVREKALKAGVKYVYVGNVHDPKLESTYCPSCGKMLIERRYYRVRAFLLERAGDKWRCPRCGHTIPIRGEFISWK
ncbi:MAG: radical SAM protein [Sulfolobales archaeon]